MTLMTQPNTRLVVPTVEIRRGAYRLMPPERQVRCPLTGRWVRPDQAARIRRDMGTIQRRARERRNQQRIDR